MDQNNSNVDRDGLLNEGLQFFGAIVASVTHELNNVLGTIDQISGLLEDLVCASAHESTATEEEMNKIAERINRQSARGTEIVKRLNKFAHYSDSPSSDFEVSDVLDNLAALMRRLVAARKVNLELSESKDDITVHGNCFLFVQAVFQVMSRILPSVKTETTIELTASEDNDGAVITIEALLSDTLTELPPCAPIEKLSMVLGGNFQEDISEGGYKCRLQIPIFG